MNFTSISNLTETLLPDLLIKATLTIQGYRLICVYSAQHSPVLQNKEADWKMFHTCFTSGLLIFNYYYQQIKLHIIVKRNALLTLLKLSLV